MPLDEFLFHKFVKYFRNKPADAALQERSVKLEKIQPRLTVLARALTGNTIDIFPAIKEGGYKGNNFFLPETFSFYKDASLNLSFYLFRILYLSVQQKLSLNWFQSASLSDEDALLYAQENSSLVLEHLFTEYPSAKHIYEQFLSTAEPDKNQIIDSAWLYGKWMADSKEVQTQEEINSTLSKIKTAEENSPKTIIKSKPVEEIVNLIIDTKQQEDYVLTHNFEKVDTADEFSGTWRDFDGDDELENHSDALDELNMKYTVRVDDVAHSVYEASFTDNAKIAESKESESEGRFVLYDEWDCYKKTYRKNYSKIYPSQFAATDADYYQNTLLQNKSILTQLRKMLASINNKWQQQRLQTQGKEIDIDMAANRFADLIAGCTPSDKVYLSDRKKEKDLSILLLLDISLSSDSYAADNRVIDVAKQTAILFGEILNEYRIDFSIHGFYSKTRNFASYITVKNFEEKWDSAKYGIGTLQPAGYTRIGPALRHSGALLQNRNSKNKWVILLSDGKPNDYDRYEGKYGINDIKQALRELSGNNINTYALAIEATAKYYLPQMFGHDHYQIVSSPVELLKSLVKLYERIRYGG
ncbi:MAG: VWA domain-containing protein [Flavobacteriaceae bacterium]|jgi:nitric oxide reductase NorD protein|nr:VWA domain-containing protein [Flavobacteriaceae bacterium]